jgi:glycerol uptake facilitator-like aquaporin
MNISLARALVAEATGTFVLVFAGCGAIIVDGKTQALGHVGVAISFGLVIMVGARFVPPLGALRRWRENRPRAPRSPPETGRR